ncbi:MAG: transposase, partial [Nitrospirota bacterium]|nr:transposase [Nitrospirota bacterium]
MWLAVGMWATRQRCPSFALGEASYPQRHGQPSFAKGRHPGFSELPKNGGTRMPKPQDRTVAALMEQLISYGPESMAQVFTKLFDLAMRLEREQFLEADLYQRTPERRGYANGYKAKKLDTPAGTITLNVPKTKGHEGEPFYPQSLERGRRSCRAVMLAVAEMYVKGVSTRDAAKVMAELGLESLSSSQVSRAAALLDEELEAWRTRELGTFPYLMLDARYEKVREAGVVRDAAL